MATSVATAELSRGLLASSAEPVRAAYVQAVAGGGQLSGPFAIAEFGLHPLAPLSLFAQGGYQLDTGWRVGAGARWDF
jgi:hypothetical protein